MTCPEEGYVGATALVACEKDVVIKLLCAITFTTLSSIEDIMDSSKFAPRASLDKVVLIRSRLDCNDVHLVQRIVMTSICLNLIQEMGSYGSKIAGEHRNNINWYHVMHSVEV